MEKVIFPNGKKLNFSIGGKKVNIGGKILTPDTSGEINLMKGSFYSKISKVLNCYSEYSDFYSFRYEGIKHDKIMKKLSLNKFYATTFYIGFYHLNLFKDVKIYLMKTVIIISELKILIILTWGRNAS